MNSIVPNFTKDLLNSVSHHKKNLEPANSKIILTKEISAFLASKGSYSWTANEKAGLFLKDGRKWANTKTSNLVQLNFTGKKTGPSSTTPKQSPQKYMDEEKR